MVTRSKLVGEGAFTKSLKDKINNNSKLQFSGWQIDLAAGAANVMGITLTAIDAEGNTIAEAVPFELWMSQDTAGIGLTAATYSGALAVTGGAQLTAFTAKKHISGVTAATGIATFTLTDTGKAAAEYVVVKAPGLRAASISVVSGTNWG